MCSSNLCMAWMAQLVRAQVSYLSLITQGVSNPEVVSSILTPSTFLPYSSLFLRFVDALSNSSLGK